MVDNSLKRSRGRPRKFDENDVLDRAMKVFWELGYEAADTETLSKRTRLSKPSLYNAFGPKEDLFLAALKRYQSTTSVQHVSSLLAAETPEEGLLNFFMSVATAVSGNNNPSGCLVACVAMPLAERMPKVAEYLNSPCDGGPNEVVKRLTEFQSQGALQDTFDIAAALELLQDLSIAMGVRARAGLNDDELKEAAKRNARLVMVEGNRNSA